MNSYDLPLPGEEPPELKPLDGSDLYDALPPLPPDHAAENERLKGEMLTLVQRHRESLEAVRLAAEILNEQLSSERTRSRRALGKLVQVVRALRRVIETGNAISSGQTPTVRPREMAIAWQEAEEVLALCAGIE